MAEEIMLGDRSGSDHMPYRLTRFIGRRVELENVARLLHERRLVTLTGAGGSGKTRLAVEAAASLAARFPDGAFLVDLAPLAQAELVPEMAARVLGVRPASDRPLLEALLDYLHERAVLLVLDNCEHLIDASGRLAAALLAGCPSLCVLATSREPLGVGGECTFRVPLLSLPDPDSPPWPDELAEFEAVQLFVDRATLSEPSFSLSAVNAAAVVKVCTRLDGIPLALELAAAALRSLSVNDLAARLDQRFRLLASVERSVPRRHQTLKALLDWSYDLLDVREQAIFRQIAVFPADWTLETAESVCGAEIVPSDVVPLVASLVNKSLVQFDREGARYRMLETVRLYALERLEEAGERRGAADRHLRWCLSLVERSSAPAAGPGQQQWFIRLEREQANLRTALTRAVETGQAEEATRLALASCSFWSARAYQREAKCWLAQILALPSVESLPARQRARLLGALGTMANTLSEFEEAERLQREALRIWQELDDRAGIATALRDLGWQCFEKMDLASAREYAVESLALARDAGEPAVVALTLHLFAVASVEGGWLDGLRPVLEECLGIWRALGWPAEMANALLVLARLEQRLGHLGPAGAHMLESLRLQVDLGDYGAMIGCMVLMLCFEFDVGKPPPGPAQSGSYQPMAYLDNGRLLNGPAEAARSLGVMAAWQERVMGAAPIQWNTMVVPVCEKLKAEMGEAAFDAEFAAGRVMTVQEIVALAEGIVAAVSALECAGPPKDAGRAARASGPAHSTHSMPASQRPEYPARLTAREAEVLRLVAAGMTNRQAAERMFVTPRTINAHLTSIYAKTGVSSRVGAVRYAVDHGLV